MIKWITIVSLCLFATANHAQTSIANERENIAYIGIDNPLSFAVFGFACGDIAVGVDNGTVMKVPNQCGRLIYRPSNTGTAKFEINGRKEEGWLKVDINHFRVIRPPSPSEVFFSIQIPDLMDELTDECCAQINIKNAQQLSVTQLVNASGMGCSLTNFHYPIAYNIKQFDYTIKRNNQIVKKHTNYGARCDTQFKEVLKSVQAGDSILFDNIRAEVSSEKYALQAFEISIVE